MILQRSLSLSWRSIHHQLQFFLLLRMLSSTKMAENRPLKLRTVSTWAVHPVYIIDCWVHGGGVHGFTWWPSFCIVFLPQHLHPISTPMRAGQHYLFVYFSISLARDASRLPKILLGVTPPSFIMSAWGCWLQEELSHHSRESIHHCLEFIDVSVDGNHAGWAWGFSVFF